MPGWVLNVATIIHSDEALLAVGFIFTIHFFNTHFRPEKFPMDTVIFTGTVPLEEFKARSAYRIRAPGGERRAPAQGTSPRRIPRPFGRGESSEWLALSLGVTSHRADHLCGGWGYR
jgi:hypothetical protein